MKKIYYITIEGKTFPSLGSAVKYYGLNEDELYRLIRKGINREKAFLLLLKVKRGSIKKYVTREGDSFFTLKAVAEHYNVSPAKLSKYKDDFEYIEDAVAVVRNKRQPVKYVTREGASFFTLKEVANHYNVSIAKLSKYKDDFEYIEDAVAVIRDNRQPVKYVTREGDSFFTLIAVAKHYNVSRVKLSKYKDCFKYIEDAVDFARNKNKPLRYEGNNFKEGINSAQVKSKHEKCKIYTDKKGVRWVLPICIVYPVNFTIDGVFYESVQSLCKIKKIIESVIRDYINQGFTLEEAYVRTIRRAKKSSSLQVVIRSVIDGGFGYVLVGHKINTIEDLCSCLGVTRSEYRGRKYIGWSTLEALGLVVRQSN